MWETEEKCMGWEVFPRAEREVEFPLARDCIGPWKELSKAVEMDSFSGCHGSRQGRVHMLCKCTSCSQQRVQCSMHAL